MTTTVADYRIETTRDGEIIRVEHFDSARELFGSLTQFYSRSPADIGVQKTIVEPDGTRTDKWDWLYLHTDNLGSYKA